MSKIDAYKALDTWPPEWPAEWTDQNPTDEQLAAWAAARDSFWAEMTDEERAGAGAPRVECAVCHKDYGRGDAPTQGPDCACCIAPGPQGSPRYLTAHYGSSFDGSAFEVLSPDIPTADPVCDACVKKYQAAGQLREIGDFLYDPGVAALVFGASHILAAAQAWPPDDDLVEPRDGSDPA